MTHRVLAHATIRLICCATNNSPLRAPKLAHIEFSGHFRQRQSVGPQCSGLLGYLPLDRFLKERVYFAAGTEAWFHVDDLVREACSICEVISSFQGFAQSGVWF